jgi:hypothetical protein
MQPLVILLNGPLGIGKSTLGEALGEAITQSVTLDGDRLAALNPPPADELDALHETFALLFAHHLERGYHRFIVNHYWPGRSEIADLQSRLRQIAPSVELRCFLLTLPKAENLQRIARRQAARAIDEAEFEARYFAEEFEHLSRASEDTGEPFDVSDPPELLVSRFVALLGLPLPA